MSLRSTWRQVQDARVVLTSCRAAHAGRRHVPSRMNFFTLYTPRAIRGHAAKTSSRLRKVAFDGRVLEFSHPSPEAEIQAGSGVWALAHTRASGAVPRPRSSTQV